MASLTAMDRYLDQIARYPLMTAGEEIQLGKLVQEMMRLKELERPLTPEEKRVVRRGERAKKRFIEANLRLVVYIAKRYAARGLCSMDILDLVQEGTVGLMRAAEMFDPGRGYKFSTYCYWWCRQAMTRALQTQERMIRRPHTVIDLAGKLPKAITEETQRLGRAPNPTELAKKLNVKESEIRLLLERGRPIMSLDAAAVNANERTIIELVADPSSLSSAEADDALEIELNTPLINLAMTALNEQERLFIELRFGLNGNAPHTYSAIATETGTNVSRERVRQILDKGLRKLRYQMALNQEALAEDRRKAAEAGAARQSRQATKGRNGARSGVRAKPALSQARQCASSHFV